MPRTSNGSARPSGTPFGALEGTFAVLCTPPRSLSIDGGGIAGLPDRAVPLTELRSILLHPSTPYDTRDAAMSALVRRAQAEGGRYLVGLAGMLLPGLRRATAALTASCAHKVSDVEAEMLAGLVAEVRRLDADRPRLASRMVWAARDAAAHLIHEELADRGRPGSLPLGGEPPQPFGHPDLVLARAVAEGVVDARQAELIGATRLGELSLQAAAERLGIPYNSAKSERFRAEAVLVSWIQDGSPTRRRPPAAAPGATGPRPGASGHPARQLAQAVAAGVVRPADADLVAARRFDGLSLAAIAEGTGLPAALVAQRQLRAEQAVLSWFDADIFAPKSARRARSKGAGCPR